MIKNFIFWLKYEVPYFVQLVFLVTFKKIDLKLFADEMFTDIRFDNWVDRLEYQNAKRNRNLTEAINILRTREIKPEFDEQGYNEFMKRFLRYQIFITCSLAFILIFIVFIIGRRII